MKTKSLQKMTTTKEKSLKKKMMTKELRSKPMTMRKKGTRRSHTIPIRLCRDNCCRSQLQLELPLERSIIFHIL